MMLRTLPYLLLLCLLTACSEPTETGSDPANVDPAVATSQPRPDARPDGSVTGELDYGLAPAEALASGPGCNLHLRPVGVDPAQGVLVGVDAEAKVARITIDNEVRVLPQQLVSTSANKEQTIYVFGSPDYKMELRLTGPKELTSRPLSGTVSVSSADGEMRAEVAGAVGC